MIRLAILSISLLTVMSGAAVAPAVADIIAYFPNSSDMLGKMVLTTPALTIIPVALVTGLLSSRISRKHLVYTGIFFYILGGAGGGLATSIPFLLSMRAVLGIGVGILMPLSTGIIADIWSGEEKARTMGLASAASNLGGFIAMLLSGLLAAVSWRASFLIYLLGIAVWVLIFFFLPENRPTAIVKSNSTKGAGQLVSYIRWGIGMFLLMIAFYSIPVNIAIYLQNHHIGDSRMAGAAMAVMTAASFLTGLAYGNLKTVLRGWLPSLSLAVFAISYYGLSAFPSVLPLFCCLMLNGMAFGILVPSIMDGVTKTAEHTSGTAGTSVVTSFLFAGQFASPLIMSETSALIFGPGISNIYLTLAFGAGLTGALAFVLRITASKRV
ncbi:MFS transporter [Maridesulfovibrio bastinii]|uniref:MFS transporter n=1 Tax=Maridesulfovibrio bastinii TaxID=47157 RepID=UPI00040CF951|nr:MFS transporter [Maridesulfovibrio bastinii]